MQKHCSSSLVPWLQNGQRGRGCSACCARSTEVCVSLLLFACGAGEEEEEENAHSAANLPPQRRGRASSMGTKGGTARR